jgi:hypothetical protein
MQQGNVSAVATYCTQSGKRRIFHCRMCATPFAETCETVFFDLRTTVSRHCTVLSSAWKVSKMDTSFPAAMT